MSPRTQKQFEEIRQEKRDLILETALEVFATHGYHGASISTIAQHAGIAKGLIYSYFKSKEDLLNEIIKKGISEMYRYFDIDHDGHLSEQEFEYFISMSLQTLNKNKEFWKLYYSIMMQPEVEKTLSNEFKNYEMQYYDMFYKFFEQRGYKDPSTEILFFSSMIKGISILIVYNEDLGTNQELVNRLEKKVLDYYIKA
jgi:AcrR family transcriptional regulator